MLRSHTTVNEKSRSSLAKLTPLSFPTAGTSSCYLELKSRMSVEVTVLLEDEYPRIVALLAFSSFLCGNPLQEFEFSQRTLKESRVNRRTQRES